jgi:penicillin-binding protein 1C
MKFKFKPRSILISLAIIAAIALAASIALLAWVSSDLPDVADVGKSLGAPSIRLTDRSGRLLYEVLPETGGRHTVLSLSQIPLTLRQATIATEDSSFYDNPGVDLAGILRAAWINLQGGETLSGGSTITQQVARGLLLTAGERGERSLRRKLRESLLAWNLARSLSKDDILALYLNQMYYGRLAYGVEAASQTFFGRPAAELDLAQSALLAGLPQAPSYYDPFQQPERTKDRQVVVLGLMEKAGLIDAAQRALAQAEPLVYNPQPYPILAPHFVMMMRSEVAGLISPEEIYRLGGITVRTTLDLDWQQHAEEAIARQLERLRQAGQQSLDANLNDAALVALDPATGQIRALVGSPDYFDDRISGAVNMALAPRQPGSALKPLIYAAAFDPTQPDPWTPATMLLDVRANFTTHDGKAYTPADYDEHERGPVLARQALASSLNIPAVLTLQHVGLPRLFSLAGSLGITTLGDPDRSDLSLALGGGEVTLVQLSAAYAALATGGLRVTPSDILDISDPQGNIVYTPPAAARPRVIDPRVAWLVTDILSDDAARELGFGLNSVLRLDRPAAVKTGTTTNFHDNWTIGYTPDLVVGVWAGNADQSAMRDVNGLTGAAPIWHEFMRTVLSGQPELAFTRPAGIVTAQVCAFSGLLPTPDCPYTRPEVFIDGTQPQSPDTVFHGVTLDSATGLLATLDTPPQRTLTRLALDLPLQAIPWAHANHQLVFAELVAASSASASHLSPSVYVGQTPPSSTEEAAASPGGILPLQSTLSPLAGAAPATPGLHILSPADHSIYTLSAGLSPDAQRLQIELSIPPGLTQVTLWIDGQLVQAFPAAPFETWWPLAVGPHTLHAEALSPAGVRLSSETISIVVK